MEAGDAIEAEATATAVIVAINSDNQLDTANLGVSFSFPYFPISLFPNFSTFF
jgi:hypothetical protein